MSIHYHVEGESRYKHFEKDKDGNVKPVVVHVWPPEPERKKKKKSEKRKKRGIFIPKTRLRKRLKSFEAEKLKKRG